VWATDSCAFFVGKAIGKNKLAPKFSPHKTVEGAIGGMCGGILFGAVAGQLLLGNIRGGLIVGLIAGVLGQIGDIFESAIKREIGVKDLGTIMPGHGGVLDRFDSLLFVGPMVALLLPWILPLIK
jgi:phosphatidate cytidylyltransferase